MTNMTSRPTHASRTAQEDADAIAKLIRDEILAFQSQDFAAWEKCWAQDESTRDVYISTTAGISVVSGWPAIASHMRNAFENNLCNGLIDFGQENLQIRVIGDCAWAVLDTWTNWENGECNECFDTRILERQDHQWKIAYSSFFLRQNNGAEGLVIGLDQKGQIVRPSQASLDGLKSHPHLTVSQGQIRAHRLDWDKTLQNAVARAGRHHGFFETHRFADGIGGPPHFPVVLGQTDDGGLAVVHLSIRDKITYLWVNAHQFLDRRMKFAQVVFSLSDGQINVARKIAMGESLRGSAQKLGISVNTARTHLSRLYEKTGVHTQAALVRLLLSVG